MSDLLQQRQHEIAEEFEFFEDWMERYEHIIELGKELDPIADGDKLDEHLIQGASPAFGCGRPRRSGNVQFRADSDAIITKGLAALMVRVMNSCRLRRSPKRTSGSLRKSGWTPI